MNTKIYYLYRDASNYKQNNEIVVEGEFTEEQVNSIIASLEVGEYFIPENVGWECERFVEWGEDDHPYCEIDENCFELTNEPATELWEASKGWYTMSIDDVASKFKEIGLNSWTAVLI